jgi:hypothetical protein
VRHYFLAFGDNYLTETLGFLFWGLSMQEIPIKNPVYLMLGASFGSAAKGTGLKALEFALSICESVDMYGFTVDPGYKEWYKNFFRQSVFPIYILANVYLSRDPHNICRTRYFSESRQGHTPLHGRAYYQMMECLGVYICSYFYSFFDLNLMKMVLE